MSRTKRWSSLLGAFALACAVETGALAATATPHPSPPGAAAQMTAPRESPRASLRLDVGRANAWVGQAIPVTVTAYFRDVDGVTLEGAPQIASSGLFTSQLSPEPHQSTQVIRGEPVLVATWTGTLTPVSPAYLDVSVLLPVHLRYHVSRPRVEQDSPFGGDPFDMLSGDPFDPSFMNRFFAQAVRQESPVERHEQEVTLRAAGHAIEVAALPSANQPASFTGAIGTFDVAASISSTKASVGDAVTLHLVVSGDGDLSRVDLPGVATSEDWKAYPPKVTLEQATKSLRARKVFDQVLVPEHGGILFVPPVSLSAFDPTLGRYTTHETKPLTVVVDGPALPTSTAPLEAPSAAASVAVSPTPPAPPPEPVTLSALLLALSPFPVLVIAALLFAGVRRTREARSLRRRMRVNAARGDAPPFYKAARTLIEHRLAERWGVRPEDVSAATIREYLGPLGDPLADAIAKDEALRFGRGQLERADLVGACSTIEQSLRGVS